MGDMLISTEPATGEEVWRGETGDAGAEVAAAAAAQPAWALRPSAERADILTRFAALVRAEAVAFADLIARETGKPLWEAATEVEAVANKVAISIAAHAERTPDKALAGGVHVRHRPHGLLAVLGPYNFPAHLPNGHIVPALLAGNSVVFKPSEKTPATGLHLVSLLRRAGIPDGVLRCLIGGPGEGKALAAHRGIDGLLFTGSGRAGMALHRQFAETPHRILALELGGNNPMVVWDGAETDASAAIAVQSAFLSAGQRCTAARRLIVRDGAHAPLVEAIAALADRIIVGAPHDDPAPFMGPVIDNGAADDLEGAFARLAEAGGRIVRPLLRLAPGRPLLSPAIIDVTDVPGRPDEEMFGPVLQIVRVPDFAAAVAEANATRYGLAAALLGGSDDEWALFRATVRAGVVNRNRPTNGAPSTAPFGGVGMSGNHRPSAYYAADYCAYPVTSVEADMPAGPSFAGLRDADLIED